MNYGGGGGRGRGRFGDPSSRILAYVVCSLSFRLSVNLSVRPCFCLWTTTTTTTDDEDDDDDRRTTTTTTTTTDDDDDDDDDVSLPKPS